MNAARRLEQVRRRWVEAVAVMRWVDGTRWMDVVDDQEREMTISNAIRRDLVAVVGVALLVLGIPGGTAGAFQDQNAAQAQSNSAPPNNSMRWLRRSRCIPTIWWRKFWRRRLFRIRWRSRIIGYRKIKISPDRHWAMRSTIKPGIPASKRS